MLTLITDVYHLVIQVEDLSPAEKFQIGLSVAELTVRAAVRMRPGTGRHRRLRRARR